MDKREIRKQFFLAVFNRDKKCRTCGVGWKMSGPQFDAHHITDRHEMPNGSYVPCGPSIQAPCQSYQFYRTDMTHEEFNARTALSQVQHAEWMRGFHEGRNYRDELRGTSNGN